MEKTNAMRILERAGAEYKVHTYEGGALSGREVAAVLGQDPERAFKTLVTVGSPRKYYVFVIPVAAELDLKKAAKAAGEKSVEMLPQKELFPLTGYVHGGCSRPRRLFPPRHEEALPDLLPRDGKGRPPHDERGQGGRAARDDVRGSAKRHPRQTVRPHPQLNDKQRNG